VILAIDPGVIKVGWARVHLDGTPERQGILPTEKWEDLLPAAAGLADVTQLVVGDGTNLVNIEPALRRLLPQVEIAVVDERGSSVEGGQLKASDFARGNPLRRLWFMLSQLVGAGVIDDYAARVLALRYIRSLKQAPE
jgi:hypothetical protein